MTKADLVEAVRQATQLRRRECIGLVEETVTLVQETLACGTSIKLSGFGNFLVKAKRARLGRNPRTGEGIEITERRVLVFQPSGLLRTRLNATASLQNLAPPNPE